MWSASTFIATVLELIRVFGIRERKKFLLIKIWKRITLQSCWLLFIVTLKTDNRNRAQNCWINKPFHLPIITCQLDKSLQLNQLYNHLIQLSSSHHLQSAQQLQLIYLTNCSWLLGTIDDNSTLFHLSHLQSLNLAYSNFLGSQLSPEFGRLKELTYLNLSASNYGGLVPHEMSHLSKLTHLDLSFCVLTIEQRTFDLLASNLTKFSLLHLGATNMSLIKHFSLLNLSYTMTDLDLGGTRIKGNFPDGIFHLPNLQYSF